jgi:hypothetical protein
MVVQEEGYNALRRGTGAVLGRHKKRDTTTLGGGTGGGARAA